MARERVTVGDIEIIALSDGVSDSPVNRIFPQVPEAEWKRYPEAFSKPGTLTINFGCYVLRSAQGSILVDTGNGPGRNGTLLDDMKRQGVKVEEVRNVVATHLHGDHYGWNMLEDGKPRFPNATYWVPKKDWEYFGQPEQTKGWGAGFLTQVLPLERAGLLKLVDGETSITPEVKAFPTPGHTPGHTSYGVSSQGQSGIILGDVFIFPFQAQEVDWHCTWDGDFETARKTRRAILTRAEQDNPVVAASHMPAPGLGRFTQREGRRFWQVL